MKKSYAILFLVLILCSIASGQNNDYKKFIGTWSGIYEGNGQTFTASVVFKEENGKLTGSAESTENQAGGEMLVENITVSGNNIKFEIMSAIKYDGIFKEGKNTIEGTLVGMNGQGVQLNMVKKEIAVQGENLDQFIGTWKATMEDNGNEMQFVLVITVKDGKPEGTIENTTYNSGPVQLENVKIEGVKLSFDIKGSSYSGVYKPEKKTIEGVGTEGENPPVTINFVKTEK